ncbi:unnamed protein product [Nippostrongylus brasiliensis]|uniref:Mitotic apparatus protein p62 n=1 Tax=Nippostrongylus brasiliensis TaxID=27835 RepID=A0A0N4YV90_NIPBR|nr:unnamed protein product [Nippostrongylus brasiliensis]
MTCTNEGVLVDAANQSFELCTDTSCRLYEPHSNQRLIKLPPHLTLHDHVVTIKWHRDDTQMMVVREREKIENRLDTSAETIYAAVASAVATLGRGEPTPSVEQETQTSLKDLCNAESQTPSVAKRNQATQQGKEDQLSKKTQTERKTKDKRLQTQWKTMDTATQANETCASTIEMGTQTLAEGFCLENKRRLSSPKEVQTESKRRKPSEEAEETEDDDEIPAAEQLEVATQEVTDTQKKDDSATVAGSPKVEAAEGLVTDPNEEVDDLEVADEVSGDEAVEEESEVEFEYEDIGEVAEEEEGEESVGSADDAENADQAPAEAVEHAVNPEQARERRIQQLTNELQSAKQERNDLKFMLDQLEGQLGPARLLRRRLPLRKRHRGRACRYIRRHRDVGSESEPSPRTQVVT